MNALQLPTFTQPYFTPNPFIFIPRNCSCHLPLVLSEGRKWKSHTMYAGKMSKESQSISGKLKKHQEEGMKAGGRMLET